MTLDRRQLGPRLLTASVGIPVAIVCSLVGGIPFLLAMNFVIGAGLFEFYRMMEAKGIKPFKTIGIILGLVVAVYVYVQGGIFSGLFITVALVVIMVLELLRKDGALAVFHMSTTILGVFYVAWLGSHVILLRQLGEGLPYRDLGGFFVIFAFALAWGADSGAYFVGHAIGKTPLLPRVSPGKSVEGAVGGAIAGLLVAFLAKATVIPMLSYVDVVTIGLVAPGMGLLGDLVESLMKRDVKIKDTSRALPGHGGMLDRFDSVLFVAPFVYYYLRFLVV
jgi:phosphatidate cytidylyltransferase